MRAADGGRAAAADRFRPPATSARRVVLHVGTPKSGTTYLQEVLWQSRPALLESGVLYPGERPDEHFRALQDLVDRRYFDTEADYTGAWTRLVDAAQQHPGTTVISHELLGDAHPDAVRRALEDLGFADLHVVVTARDLARQLPAVWQEDVKNRHYLPFDDFLEIVRPGSGREDVWRPPDEQHGDVFWRRQDIPAILRRWAADLPASSVHVVTVPPAGSPPEVVWQRFAEVLGVDAGIATQPEGQRNRSLGRVESELLRRLNERLEYSIPWDVYAPRVTRYLASVVLPERAQSTKLVLPPEHRAWVSEASTAMLARLSGLPHTLVGDLADLRGAAPDDDPTGYEQPSDEQVLDVALDALAALIPLPEPPPPPPPLPQSLVARGRRRAVRVARRVPGVPWLERRLRPSGGVPSEEDETSGTTAASAD